jgi:hypothetical protein
VVRNATTDSVRLRVWLVGCGDPNTLKFRVKRRQYALNVSSTAVTLQNLTFRATAFSAYRADLVLDSVNLSFPTSSGRAAGAKRVTLDMDPLPTREAVASNSVLTRANARRFDRCATSGACAEHPESWVIRHVQLVGRVGGFNLHI